jgi:hypothetical protein
MKYAPSSHFTWQALNLQENLLQGFQNNIFDTISYGRCLKKNHRFADPNGNWYKKIKDLLYSIVPDLNMNKRSLLKLLFIFGLVFLLMNSHTFAQKGTIRGFIYEKETGEPVIFTNVYLYKTTYGAATDVNGFYLISKIPSGDYDLIVSCLGYDTLRIPVSIMADQLISKNLFLEKASVQLEAVKISAERQAARIETKTSVIKITPKQINQLPSIGGQPDLAQYLQVLPGVIFTGDQGGQLYIRGGSPIQNKVLLDGMIIYKPFHSIGLFSVFDTDILRNADVYTGGFGAEFGDRISSVMDITTKDGNKRRYGGKVGASTFGAKVMLEGPIVKQRDPGKGCASFVFSMKNSYLKQSSKIFYNYVNENGLPFNYLDTYGKISIHGANGSKVNFFGFHFNDEVKQYQSIADYSWQSSGGGMTFLVIPGKSPVLLEGHVAYSEYKIKMEDDIFPTRESEVNGFSMGMNFSYFLGKDELKYGLELMGFKTDMFYVKTANTVIDPSAEFTTELGMFVKYKKIFGKFIIEPGFRLQWYATLSNISPEPRLAMKYNVTDNFRIKLAGGLYSQNFVSGTSDMDVVNLFYAFISGILDHPETFDGKEIKQEYQKAQHIILGTEFDAGQRITINVEAYYKNFPQLFNINRNKIYNSDPNFIVEKGNAEGIDFALKYDWNNIYLWAVYSFAFVNRYYENDEGEMKHYYPHYDRRHNINLVASYRFGGNLNWEASARWNFGSGFPFTETQGFYEKIPFTGGISTNYTTVNGYIGYIPAELNKGRLPSYHRLDLDLKRKFFLSEHTTLDINVSVTNVYDRKNIFYINRFEQDKIIYQLPVMPSIGVNLAF